MPEIVDSLSEQLCGAPLELPCCTDPTQLDETSVAAGRYRYFSPECGVGDHALEVVMQTVSGECHLFVSTSTTTPGPLQNDGADQTDAALKRVRLEGPRTEVSRVALGGPRLRKLLVVFFLPPPPSPLTSAVVPVVVPSFFLAHTSLCPVPTHFLTPFSTPIDRVCQCAGV